MPREVKWLAYVGVMWPTMESAGSRKEYKRQYNLWYKANNPGYREMMNAASNNYQRARKNRDPEYKTYWENYYRDHTAAAGWRRNKSGRGKMDNVPDWLTDEHVRQMRAVYRHARLLTKETGIKHEVDHIYPVMGRDKSGEHISCGLHVPWNLQILTAENNRIKGRMNPVEGYGDGWINND